MNYRYFGDMIPYDNQKSLLTHLRKEKGLSIRDLSGETGVSKSSINDIETRITRISKKHARIFGKFFGVDPKELINK